MSLQRYGLQWNGPREFVSTPMADGYWTPWHVAADRIAALEAELAESRRKTLEKSRLPRQASTPPQEGKP